MPQLTHPRSFRLEEWILDGMRHVKNEHGVSQSAFVRLALIEKLKAYGITAPVTKQ